MADKHEEIDLSDDDERALDAAAKQIEEMFERRRLRKEQRKANGTAENPDTRHNLPVKE